LLVLALAFLNFGHANVAFADGGRLVVTTDSWCGNPLIPNQGDHTPCHACRIGQGADLPPVPICIEPVEFVASPIAYVDTIPMIDRAPLRLVATPRGPPLV
jgi:prepilin-type processing-associated H-X9-DG protein